MATSPLPMEEIASGTGSSRAIWRNTSRRITRRLLSRGCKRRIDARRGDSFGRMIPLIGSLFICEPGNARARQELLKALGQDWVLHDLFTPGNFPWIASSGRRS